MFLLHVFPNSRFTCNRVLMEVKKRTRSPDRSRARRRRDLPIWFRVGVGHIFKKSVLPSRRRRLCVHDHPQKPMKIAQKNIKVQKSSKKKQIIKWVTVGRKLVSPVSIGMFFNENHVPEVRLCQQEMIFLKSSKNHSELVKISKSLFFLIFSICYIFLLLGSLAGII